MRSRSSSRHHPRIFTYRRIRRGSGSIAAPDQTIARYVYEVSRWVLALGVDPATYDATTIRNVVLSQAPNRSRSSVRLTATVLRSYFRFLAARGECRPELYLAVPSVARRHLAPLPRYASAATIERIIASCDAVTTPVRLRDRAIILLLARLGLRAGDIRRLRLDDIDWANALISFMGKAAGRRACHCRKMPATPCSPISRMADRWSHRSVCSCASTRLTPARLIG